MGKLLRLALLGALLTAVAACSCGPSGTLEPADAEAGSREAVPGESPRDSHWLAGTLSELDAMPAPAGVEPEVFAALKLALADALSARFGDGAADKLPSTPPLDDRSAPPLSYDSEFETLSWRYHSTGDYNQDGYVTINDITPLGQNYNVEGPFDPISAQSCVDGNGDKWITINDITQIGQNFGDNVVSYRVYVSAAQGDYPTDAADDNGAAALTEEIDFADAGEPEGERKAFQLVVETTEQDQYAWVRPVDDEGQEGIASALAAVPGVAANQEPVAVLTADPVEGPAPLTVSFDASGSSDPEGPIAKFEFDFEEDGTWVDNGTNPLAEYTYIEADRVYAAAVRVTDDHGATAAAAVAVTTLPAGEGDTITVKITITILPGVTIYSGATMVQLWQGEPGAGGTPEGHAPFYVIDEPFDEQHQGMFDDVPISTDLYVRLFRAMTDWDGDGTEDHYWLFGPFDMPPDRVFEISGVQVKNAMGG